MTKVRFLKKSVRFRKSDITNGKRIIKLPRNEIFFGIGCEIVKILTKDRQILQSFASVPKNYQLTDKGLEIYILRADILKIVSIKCSQTGCMIYCLANYDIILFFFINCVFDKSAVKPRARSKVSLFL